jgi:hypothetical protein
MGVAVNVNGLSLVHKGSGGISIATVPDVCKTPSPGGPVPIPYPNITFSRDLAKGTTTVAADGGNMIAIDGSESVVSTGDEPGVVGGVKSGVNKHKSTWLTFSSDVKIEAKGACRLTDKKLHNKGNTVDAAGKIQIYLPGEDIKINIACTIFCRTRELEKGHKDTLKKKGLKPEDDPFQFSTEAKKLGETEYADVLRKHGMKTEPRLLVRIEKATANAIRNRKIYQQASEYATKGAQVIDNVTAKLLKEAEEYALKAAAKMLGKKAAAKAAKKAATIWLKAIPIVNVISTAYDIYDYGSLAYEGYKLVGELKDQYLQQGLGGFVEANPDLGIFDDKGNLVDAFDYKNTTDRWRDQQDQILQDATGQYPKAINMKRCNNCNSTGTADA